MTNRIIEAVVSAIFGAVIVVVGLVEHVDWPIIVLGAILAVVGVGCLIWALVDKNKQETEIAFVKAEYETRLESLEKEVATVNAEKKVLTDKLNAAKAEAKRAKQTPTKPAEHKPAEAKKQSKK